MTRIEFLKSIGFRGPALMAMLTSCVREEDTFIDAVTIPGTSTTPTSTTSPTSTTTSSGTSTSPTSSTSSSTTATSGGVDPTTITSYKLKIDLTAASSASLKTAGGYLISSGIVVAFTSAGTYVAATQTCSHEPRTGIIFRNGEFYCNVHGARFSTTGAGLNSYGIRGLTVYKTATNGSILVVY